MPFPDSPREIYDNNPLEEVVCCVKYPPILKIRSHIEGFQDTIRKKYPFYEEERDSDTPEELAEVLSRLPFQVPGLDSHVGHRFISQDNLRSVFLAVDKFEVADCGYLRWEDFEKNARYVEELFAREYEPGFYQSVSLRFRNTIDREALGLEDVSWGELINPAFAGTVADEDLGNFVASSQTRTLIVLKQAQISAVGITHGLRLVRDEHDRQKQEYVINAEFFTADDDEIEEGRTTDEVFERLASFRLTAGRLFRWCTTEKLRTALGRQTLE